MNITPLRARLGYRLAQVGAAMHVIGGTADLFTRRLQPFHVAYLGVLPDGTDARVASLVLALLHALGTTLVAGGIAMLVLLHLMRRSGNAGLAYLIALVAFGCEGTVGIQMLRLGFGFGWIPLAIATLVWVGIALCLVPRFAFRQDAARPATTQT